MNYERNKKRREKWKFNSRIIKSLGKLCKSNSQIFIKWRNFKDKKYVPEALAGISHLIIDNDENGNPVAFMGIEENKLEMLFITSDYRGKGIGKKMLSYGIENYGVTNLAVNEDNPQAKVFYEHMGFKVYQRNELDDQGNPYPVLYMKLDR